MAPGVVNKNEVTFHTNCGSIEITVKIVKLDEKNWEYRTHTVQRGGPTAADLQANLTGMKSMLEFVAKNGSVAERERAAKALVQFDQQKDEMVKQAAKLAAQQPQMDAMRAKALAAAGLPANTNTAQEWTSVQHMTKIADSCSAK